MQPGSASKADSQSTRLGNSDFCSAWFSVRGQSEIPVFPENLQDHKLTGFAGILFGLDIKYRLNWCMLRCTYWIFKCMYLKSLCCWKSEQTQQQFVVVGHFSIQKENKSCSIRKSYLNPSKSRQSWLAWADVAEMPISPAQRAITRK